MKFNDDDPAGGWGWFWSGAVIVLAIIAIRAGWLWLAS